MGTKNNPENRGRVTELRKHQGQDVKPVYYFGKHKGHGNYIAAMSDNGKLVLDAYGRPIPYQSI